VFLLSIVENSAEYEIEEFEKSDDAIVGSSSLPNLFYRQEIQKLSFWCTSGSWNYCEGCLFIIEEKLIPSYTRRVQKTAPVTCTCANRR